MLRPQLEYDLSEKALEKAVGLYYEAHHLFPICLIVNPCDLTNAYNLTISFQHKLAIVSVPSFPKNAWMLSSVQKMFFILREYEDDISKEQI